jgi:hypothetical protein
MANQNGIFDLKNRFLLVKWDKAMKNQRSQGTIEGCFSEDERLKKG